MTDRTIRIGIIGAGRMGITHYSIINSREDVRVVATADPSMLMNKMLSKYAGVKTYKDYRPMLDKEELDAVLVCTPPAMNFEILKDVAARGIHAFVEKPFTLSAEHGRELSELFAARRLVSQVGYVNRFNDMFTRAKAMVADGLIGRPARFRSEMYSATIAREQDEEGWRATHANGGGATYEMASHAIDLITYIFGRPDRVSGTSLTRLFSKQVEDVVASNFSYRGGLGGSIYVNWSDASYRKPTNKLEIFGDRGKIQADQHGMKLFLVEDRPDQGFARGWNQLYITDVFSNVPFYLRGIEFTAQLYDFVDCIRDGRTDTRCGFAAATDTLAIIDAMFADHAHNESELAR
jgi:predicted dehydrogenase